MGRGLSPEQAMLLRALGAPGPAVPVRMLLAAVYPEAATGESSPEKGKALVALDRSLRRLEARGLVTRFGLRAGIAAVAATEEGFHEGRKSRHHWKWRDFSGEIYLTRHRLGRLRGEEEAADF